MQVVLVGAVQNTGDAPRPGPVLQNGEHVAFAEIAAVDRIISDFVQLQLVHAENLVLRADPPRHAGRIFQIAGRVQAGVKCDRVHPAACLLCLAAGEFQEQAAVHAAGKCHAEILFCQLFHVGFKLSHHSRSPANARTAASVISRQTSPKGRSLALHISRTLSYSG